MLLWQAEVEIASGRLIVEVCHKLSICNQIFYRWRIRYGGVKVEEIKQLRELQAENDRLKKIVANQALDIQMLKEVNRGNF